MVYGKFQDFILSMKSFMFQSCILASHANKNIKKYKETISQEKYFLIMKIEMTNVKFDTLSIAISCCGPLHLTF